MNKADFLDRDGVINKPIIIDGKSYTPQLLKKTLNEMHSLLKTKVSIDKIYYCPHTRSDKCKCRKPKLGMIIKASNESKIYLKESYMVDDRKIDIDAGLKAGCKTIFVNNNYYEKRPTRQEKTVKSLHAAVKYILKKIIK